MGGSFTRWDHWAFEISVMLAGAMGFLGFWLVAGASIGRHDGVDVAAVALGLLLAFAPTAFGAWWWIKARRGLWPGLLATPLAAVQTWWWIGLGSTTCPPSSGDRGFCFNAVELSFPAVAVGLGMLAGLVVWWLRQPVGAGDGVAPFAMVAWSVPSAIAATWLVVDMMS